MGRLLAFLFITFHFFSGCNFFASADSFEKTFAEIEKARSGGDVEKAKKLFLQLSINFPSRLASTQKKKFKQSGEVVDVNQLYYARSKFLIEILEKEKYSLFRSFFTSFFDKRDGQIWRGPDLVRLHLNLWHKAFKGFSTGKDISISTGKPNVHQRRTDISNFAGFSRSTILALNFKEITEVRELHKKGMMKDFDPYILARISAIYRNDREGINYIRSTLEKCDASDGSNLMPLVGALVRNDRHDLLADIKKISLKIRAGKCRSKDTFTNGVQLEIVTKSIATLEAAKAVGGPAGKALDWATKPTKDNVYSSFWKMRATCPKCYKTGQEEKGPFLY